MLVNRYAVCNVGEMEMVIFTEEIFIYTHTLYTYITSFDNMFARYFVEISRNIHYLKQVYLN